MAVPQRTDPGFARYTGDERPNIWAEHLADHNALASGSVSNTVAGVTFTIGTIAGDVINIGIVLEDADGNALTAVANVIGFLSDDIAGLDVSGTAPDGTFIIGTDGFILASITAKLVFLLQSDAIGAIDLDITETGADTWYFVVVLANGTQVVSSAIVIA
jgi:hypothetical protein